MSVSSRRLYGAILGLSLLGAIGCQGDNPNDVDLGPPGVTPADLPKDSDAIAAEEEARERENAKTGKAVED